MRTLLDRRAFLGLLPALYGCRRHDPIVSNGPTGGPIVASADASAVASAAASDDPLEVEVPSATPPATPLPPKTPIEHVVVIIKENRTYDALFGDFPEGVPWRKRPAEDPRCKQAFEDDEGVAHGREVALDKKRQLRCFQKPDKVAVYHDIAKHFTLCARFFSEVRGPSYPNHLMLVAAQAPKNDDPNDPPKKWTCPKHCYDIPTFVEQFAAAGLSWKAYDQTAFVSPFSMIQKLKDSPNVVFWREFEDDARAGRLPALSYVFSEQSESEHPPADLCAGQNWTLRQLRALAEGPKWDSTAAFVLWDDWGGFYDHVKPPVVEKDKRGKPLRYGYRVPCLVVSPYAKKSYISMERHSFLSVLRFAEDVFKLPSLNERVAEASRMGDCFDFTQEVKPAVLPGALACKKGRGLPAK